MITAIFVIVEVFILLKNSLYYYYIIIILLYYIGLLSERSRKEKLSLRSDIWGSSYTITLHLFLRHIPTQFWSTLQDAFAVWHQILLFANLKFHCFEVAYFGFI